MKDIKYVDVQIQLNRNKSRSYKEDIIKSYSSLIDFCLKEGLLVGDFFNKDNTLREDSIVYESNLTERGKPIFYNLMLKWLKYLDRTNKYDNKKMLEKYLNQLEK